VLVGEGAPVAPRRRIFWLVGAAALVLLGIAGLAGLRIVGRWQ